MSNNSDGMMANMMAPPIMALDTSVLLASNSLVVLPFHVQADQPFWNSAMQHIEEPKAAGREPCLYVDFTCKDMLLHWVPADAVSGRVSLKNEDDGFQLSGSQKVSTRNALTTAFKSATDTAHFFRSVQQWVSAFMRYAAVAVCAEQMKWSQVISHVDVAMGFAEFERNKGRPQYVAFLYDMT
ncbi:unnamed protein product [Polarella glacialis]|uniref:Uncharacterized protein n=1 Tax=Polarella glacialis TaxID=89957 RepID=A0A813IYH7_POLGL|nr:unnamed protein product [Polarella glacialis]CAE8661338.1 unnamed protein product [Polarella glacialis]